MKLALLISVCILSFTVTAQYLSKNQYTPEYQQLRRNKLVVVLTGQAETDSLIANVFRADWTVTPILQFCTRKEAEKMTADSNLAFALIGRWESTITSRQDMQTKAASYQITPGLFLLAGGKKSFSRYSQDNDVVGGCNFGIDKHGKLTGYQYKVQLGIRWLNRMFTLGISSDTLQCGNVKNKILVFPENTYGNKKKHKELAKDILEKYPYPGKVLSGPEVSAIIASRDSSYAVIDAARFGSEQGHTIYDAKTGAVLCSFLGFPRFGAGLSKQKRVTTEQLLKAVAGEK
jgi:hypothetical protein